MQEQIRKADWVLDKLSSFGAVVAGGAPRDWSFGKSADDIDVFIAGQISKGQIKEALGLLECNLIELGDQEEYTGAFQAYSFEDEDGQEFQILCFESETVEEVVNDFPLALSKAIYYGKGEFWYDDWFNVCKKWEINLAYSTNPNFSWEYLDKIIPRFRNFYVTFSEEETLSRIGDGMVGYAPRELAQIDF